MNFNWIKKHFLAILCSIAFAMTLFAFVAPWLFASHSGSIAFNSETGAIGDTFGIMNPFVAIAAAAITFAAFWTQYQANQEMLKENRKQQTIARFYELLKIHRENVKQFEWVQSIYSTKNSISKLINNPEEELIDKNGREIFFYYLIEFTLIYDIIGILAPNLKNMEKIQRAYGIFYLGKKDEYLTNDLRNELYLMFAEADKKYFSQGITRALKKISRFIESPKTEQVINTLFQHRKFFLSQPPFFGHFEELSNYYRHLFLTVETIANEKNLSFSEKRELLQILQAQLSNREQIMLFYNWFSGYGDNWEEKTTDGNHFFTKYRMICGIIPQLMVPFKSEDENILNAYKKFIRYFSQCKSVNFFGSNDDPIFEFEKGTDCPKFKYDK